MHVRQPADEIDRLSITVNLALHEARCLLIGAKVGRHRILYTTSELLRGLDEAPCLELCGSPDTPGQIVFAGPVQVRLNGAPVTAAPADGGYAIKYRHCRNPLSLEID